jgi:hypothetical protein
MKRAGPARCIFRFHRREKDMATSHRTRSTKAAPMEDAPVRITVDGPALAGSKSAFGLPGGLESATQKVVELSGQAFRTAVAGAVGAVAKSLESVDLPKGQFAVEEVKFTLSFDAAGEVSIFAVGKGSLASKSGIEVVLKRVPKP